VQLFIQQDLNTRITKKLKKGTVPLPRRRRCQELRVQLWEEDGAIGCIWMHPPNRRRRAAQVGRWRPHNREPELEDVVVGVWTDTEISASLASSGQNMTRRLWWWFPCVFL
jgi:hypothetical protein